MFFCPISWTDMTCINFVNWFIHHDSNDLPQLTPPNYYPFKDYDINKNGNLRDK